MKWGAWTTIALFCVTSTTVEPADASPSSKLVYVRGAGAESCPAEAELRSAVAVRLGYDPFLPGAQKMVLAQVARVTRGYRGKVQIVEASGTLRGERELSTSGDDCGELVDALALAVSIALDDETAPEETPDPPPPPRALPVAVIEEPPVVATRRAPPDSPKEGGRVVLALSLGPTLSVGSAPKPVAGTSVAGSARWSWFALRLDIRGELPATKAIFGGGHVATSAVLALASACANARLPFFCAGLGSGILFSETASIERPRSDRGGLFVGALRGGVNVPLSDWLYLEPTAEVGLQFLSRAVSVDDVVVHRISPAWGALALHFGGHLAF